MKKLIKYLLLFGVFYYLLQDLDIEKTIYSIGNYSLIAVIFTMCSVVLSDLVLSLRWQKLGQNKFSLLESFEAIGISAFLNFILPAKLGELSKIIYLKKVYGFNANNTFSVLILERVFDVLFLGFFSMMIATIFLNNALILESSLVFIGLTALFFILVKSKKFKKLLKKITSKVVRANLLKIVSNLEKALNRRTFTTTLLLTLLVWVTYFLTVFIFLKFATSFNLTFIEIFTVFVISSIAMSIPLLPGGVGTYQAGIVFALGLYGVGKEEALMIGLVLHLMILIPSVIVVLFILFNKNISLSMFYKGDS